ERSEAIQLTTRGTTDCFVAIAPRNDDGGVLRPHHNEARARSGHSLSYFSPPTVLSLMLARISPGVGRVLGSTRLSGFQRSERTMARAHWKYNSSIVITMTVRGFLPSIAKEASSSGSTERRARPLTRSVVPEPGIRNSSATRGSRTMLRKESMRLLPRRSGIISVLSSSMRTKPARAPRGEQSSPPGRQVASAGKGDFSIITGYGGATRSATFTVEASLGKP